MKNMLLFIFLIILSFGIHAQSSIDHSPENKDILEEKPTLEETQVAPIEYTSTDKNERPRKRSYRQIKELAKGVLLVRLHKNEKKIQRLLDLGYKKAAQKARDEVALENEKIKSSFKEHFDFCKVYFFESQYTKEIQSGNYAHLINYKGENNIQIKSSKYIYFAEMSKVKMDTGFNKRYKSIVLMDTHLNQLSYPFPFSKMFNFFKTNKYQKRGTFINEVIKGLNEDLIAYYNLHG